MDFELVHFILYLDTCHMVLLDQIDPQLTFIFDSTGVQALRSSQFAPFVILWVCGPTAEMFGYFPM